VTDADLTGLGHFTAPDPIPDAEQGSPPGHWLACQSIARWFLGLSWCDFAVCEISGRVVGDVPQRPDWKDYSDQPMYGTYNGERYAPCPDEDAWARYQAACAERDKAARERMEQSGGQLDVLGLATGRKRQHEKNRRIGIAEVKVTRGDLRQDLKRGKMLRYERQATHVYLAATPEALNIQGGGCYYTSEAVSDVLEDLGERGLPKHWGVVLIRWQYQRGRLRLYPITMRNPRRYPHGCDPTPELCDRLIRQAAVSLCHRALRE